MAGMVRAVFAERYGMTIEQAFQQAVQHHQAGRLVEAEAAYRQILAVQPRHAHTLHLLGVIAHQVKKHSTAIDLITKAIAIESDIPDFHSNIGEAFRALGQIDAAIASFRQAVILDPNFPEAHNNLGVALMSRGLFEESTTAFLRASALNPGYAEAFNNLGNCLRESGQLDEAIEGFRQAIDLKSDFAEAYYNLGNAFNERGQSEEGIRALRRAIAVNPDYPEAHNNLGLVLKDIGCLDEAIRILRRGIALKPDFAEAHNNLGIVLKDKGQIEDAIAILRRAVEVDHDDAGIHSNLIYTMLFQWSSDALSLQEESCRWSSRFGESVKLVNELHANDRDPERRMRIGYVSPDFWGTRDSSFSDPAAGIARPREIRDLLLCERKAPGFDHGANSPERGCLAGCGPSVGRRGGRADSGRSDRYPGGSDPAYGE